MNALTHVCIFMSVSMSVSMSESVSVSMSVSVSVSLSLSDEDDCFYYGVATISRLLKIIGLFCRI